MSAPSDPSQPSPSAYGRAFVRNHGVISPEEQQKLRESRVAIVGMGDVGGAHLEALVRLGVGRFSIADPDTFDVPDTNRQQGARVSTLGRPKVQVMAETARDIDPEVEIRVFQDPIGPQNARDFLRDADLLIGEVDFSAIDTRRMLFRMAAEQGVFALTAAPAGFGTAWLVFDPAGMSFDRYFDFSDTMDRVDQVVAMAVGLDPKALQAQYTGLEDPDLKGRTAPCIGLACHLACGVTAAEAMKILLGRGRIWPAPYYHHFDPYGGKYVRRRLWGGNRHPWRRLKRRILARRLRRQGL